VDLLLHKVVKAPLGLGFKVWGSEFGVQGLEFRV
jgi:hypothetical protein